MDFPELGVFFDVLEKVRLQVIFILVHILDVALTTESERATKVLAIFLVILLNVSVMVEEAIFWISCLAQFDN